MPLVLRNFCRALNFDPSPATSNAYLLLLSNDRCEFLALDFKDLAMTFLIIIQFILIDNIDRCRKIVSLTERCALLVSVTFPTSQL